MKAAECEKRAVGTRDPELKRYYMVMAKDWWDMARQVERLEAEIADLASQKNSKPSS